MSPAQKSPTSSHLNTYKRQILEVAHKPCVISPGSSLVLLLPLSLQHSITATLASWLFLKPATYSQTSGPLTVLCLLPWKILPLHNHMIQFLTFFMALPSVTLSEKNSLKTIFQIIPPCINPFPSPCFLFLHSISIHSPIQLRLSFYCLSPARMQTL